MSDPIPNDPTPPPRPWWRGPMIWSLVLSMAVVAYELTAQPAVAVVTVSLKIGWGRFVTAVWLLRQDPVRPRGRACFWLYLGSGFWTAALTSFFFCLAFPQFLPKPAFGAGNGPRDLTGEAFIGACITWTVGTLLASAALGLAVILAFRHRIRLWLHGDVGLARERGEWPPVYGPRNQIAFPLIVLLAVVALVVGVPTMLLADYVLDEAGAAIGRKTRVIVFAVGLSVGLPVASLILFDRIRNRVIAREPGECWDDPVPVDPPSPPGV